MGRRLFCWWWARFIGDHTVVRITGWNKCVLDSPWGERTRVEFVWPDIRYRVLVLYNKWKYRNWDNSGF